jgi:hypothetical protein
MYNLIERLRFANKLLLLGFCLFSISAYSQSDTLINPNKEGGFELGNGSFAANGWSVSTNNATALNQWTVNNGARIGFSGNYCAYITNDPTGNPPRHQHAQEGNDAVYFYRTITFPKGKTQMYMTLSLTGAYSQSLLKVWLLPQNATTLSQGIALKSLYGFSTSYLNASFALDRTIIGNCTSDTTWLVAFSWQHIEGDNYTQSPAVDNIGLYADGVSPAMAGVDTVFTIDNTRPTAGTNFESFKDVETALNSLVYSCNLISKTLIFNVSAGQTFVEPPLSIKTSGSVQHPIVFQKKGAGANPVIKPKLSDNQSSALTLFGCDYLTFDGIDIIDNNDTSNFYLSSGILVQNGAQNNTFVNSTIVLNKRSRFDYQNNSTGIQQKYTVEPTQANNTNSNNRYLNLTIRNCKYGIALGSSSTFLDSNIEIGTTDPEQFMSIEIPEDDDIESYAIYTTSCSNLKIHHIKSNAPLGLYPGNGQTDIYSNKIVVSKAYAAIQAGISKPNTKLNIYNNFISLRCSNLKTDQHRTAISLSPSNFTPTSSTLEFNVYNNSILIDASLAKTFTGVFSQCLGIDGACRLNVYNNIFYNATQDTNRANNHTCITYLGNADPDSARTLSMNYNAFWRKSNSTKIAYYYDPRVPNNVFANTLSEWQNAFAAVRPDANSVEADPMFLNETNLHAYGTGIDGKGTTPPNNLTTDIDNEPRTAPFDIGADQFTRQSIDLAISDIIEPNDSNLILCGNQPRNIRVKIVNVGNQPLDFAQVPSVFKVVVTKPIGKDSFLTTLSSGILPKDSFRVMDIAPFTPIESGDYSFQIQHSNLSDNNRSNDTFVVVKTLIVPKALPLDEGFEQNGQLPGWQLSTDFYRQNRGKTGNSISAFVNGNQLNRFFILPKLAKITEANTFLRFDYRVVLDQPYYSSLAVPYLPWGKIDVMISTDCGATFSILKTIDTSNHKPTIYYQSVNIPLSNFINSECIIKFVVNNSALPVYMDFDNLYVGVPCSQLSGFDAIEAANNNLTCVSELGIPVTLTVRPTTTPLFGTTYQWQYSADSLRTWANLAGANGLTQLIYAKGFPIHYRLKTTCQTDNSSRFSQNVRVQPQKLPIVAHVPFTESFESWQSSVCLYPGNSNDLPSLSWTNPVAFGDNSPRRNDQGSTASWNNFGGDYTPTSTSGQYSARFNSPFYGNKVGSLDLHLDLSSATDKQISFDFINTGSVNGLTVLLSKDGGMSFQQLDTPLSIATTWRRVKYNIPRNGSPTSVLRFIPTLLSYTGNNSAIGLDSLTIEDIVAAPTCATFTTPQNDETNVQDDALFTWRGADYATGYRIKIGTTANGSDVLPMTDIGANWQYRYPNFLDYQKRYFVTLEPYNRLGAAQGCPSVGFTTMKNPNFGGGRDGLDSAQLLSGSYRFANSTNAASNAPYGKAVYAWVNPQNHQAYENTFSNSPTSGVISIRRYFNPPIYNALNSNYDLYINSNGILGYTTDLYSPYTPLLTIPSSLYYSFDGIIAACYAPLYRAADSRIFVKSDASEIIVTWWHFYATDNIGGQDTSTYITFQVIMKPNEAIKIQFNADESSANRTGINKIWQTALVGIGGYSQLWRGMRGIQYRNQGRGGRLFDEQGKPLAIEFRLPSGDLSVEDMTKPNYSSPCPQDVNPSVKIRNNNGLMDFSKSPTTVQLKITGARTQTLTRIIDTGFLAPNSDLEITFPNPLSMDVAGQYNFEISVKNPLDDNPRNDTFRTTRSILYTAVNAPYLQAFDNMMQAVDGNKAGFSRVISNFGLAIYGDTYMRLRRSDYFAFDYRLRFPDERVMTANDWYRIEIGFQNDCNQTFIIVDTLSPATHTPTAYWRQKVVKIPDSLAGKLLQPFIRLYTNINSGTTALDLDNIYVGRACDSTQIDIGNITAPPSVCLGDALRAGVFERPIAPYIQYKWQYSLNNGTSWAELSGAEGNNYISSQLNLTATYRAIGKCILTQISDTTDGKLIAAFTPEYAPLPYNQSFENWQTSSCNNTTYTNDVPDAYWLNLPQYTSGSWRRNDQGSLGGWLNKDDGTYTPGSSQGSYSARFHSSTPYPPSQGSLNLFVNLSGTTDKTLAFDYLNKTGSDSLRVSWSTDGGLTFRPLSNLNLASSWTQYSYSLTGGTAQSVIRFEGVNLYEQYGRDDIGLDNLRVFANNFTNDAAISSISPQLFGCQNAVQPLTVQLRNAGIEALNLATTPVTVNVSVSGALSRSFTKTVNTGSLAVGALLDVVLDPSFTLSAVGIYNIDASLVSAADLNAINNTLKIQVRVVSETTVPYIETFDASPNFPIGWVTEGGVRVDTSWRNNDNFRIGFYMASYFDPNLNTKGGSFTSPKIGVVRANDVLSFDAFIARYNEGLPSGVDWGNVEATISDDCGQTWKTVWTANGANFNSSIIASNIRIPLSNYVGKSIIMRFTAVYKSDSYFIWFDNFRVDTKCIGAPTIAPITGNATACYGERVALQTAVSSGIGLTWAWQKQDTAAWIGFDTNKIQTTTFPLFLPTKYRVVAMCLMDSTTATSAPFSISVGTPVYAQPPYRQDFETWQSCGTSSSQALPDASWVQQNYTGNVSWRRNDNGLNAAWTNPTAGEYTPLSTKGSYSARYHGSQVPYGTNTYFDLYLDLSQTSGAKYLSFDYFSTSSGNSLTLSISKDGGKTFDNLDYIYDSNGWVRTERALYSESAKTIIRFIGYCYPFTNTPADIGVDNLVVSNSPMPSCVEILTPSAWSSDVTSDVVFKWRSSAGAKSYKIKIGTTQNGSEFLPLTSVGQDTFFKPTQRLGFLTTYFVTVIPFDSLSNARFCYPIQFSTQRNPNFGGGVNGNDPNQPMAGGYFFANSTPAAAAALPSQPRYVWIDPLSNNHTAITTWTTGNSNNGSFTLPNIGFDFSFYGTIYRNNIYVNSNGALHFGTANSSTGANESIPNSSTPNNFLAACWMDLAAGSDGKVYYGKSASGEYVVTWWHFHDVEANGTTIDTAEYITFQAILNPNGTIKVQFNDSESTANNGRVFDILNDALIGIEDASGSMGIQYRNNGGPAPMFSSPLAIAFALNNKLLPTQNPFNTEGVSVGDVSPNPSSNLFSFDFYTPQKMALTLKLSNSLGQVVWLETQNTQTGKQQKTVEWANLPSGVYWLTVVTEQGQRFVQRVVRD